MSVKLHYGDPLQATNLHPLVEAILPLGLGLLHHLDSCHYSNTGYLGYEPKFEEPRQCKMGA